MKQKRVLSPKERCIRITEKDHCAQRKNCARPIAACQKGLRSEMAAIIPAGGFRAEGKELPEVFDLEYRTDDGELFMFHLVLIRKPENCYYEPEIVCTPPVDNFRSQNEHIIHTSPSSSGGRMICRGDFKTEFATLQGAIYWCKEWAKYFNCYNKTGQKFPGDE